MSEFRAPRGPSPSERRADGSPAPRRERPRGAAWAGLPGSGAFGADLEDAPADPAAASPMDDPAPQTAAPDAPEPQAARAEPEPAEVQGGPDLPGVSAERDVPAGLVEPDRTGGQDSSVLPVARATSDFPAGPVESSPPATQVRPGLPAARVAPGLLGAAHVPGGHTGSEDGAPAAPEAERMAVAAELAAQGVDFAAPDVESGAPGAELAAPETAVGAAADEFAAAEVGDVAAGESGAVRGAGRDGGETSPGTGSSGLVGSPADDPPRPDEADFAPLDAGEPEPGTAAPDLNAALEAILIVVDEPVDAITLAQVLERPTHEVEAALNALAAEYSGAGRGFDLREVAGGWRFYSRADCAPLVERFVRDGQQARLTQAALETLAVVAYRQPVSRARVAAVRGVNSDGVMRTLVARGLVEEAGTDPESQAVLYRTSSYFLERLGLKSLDELPELAPFLPDDVENLEETTK